MSRPTSERPTVDQITDLLRAVVDPELGSDVVDLGMASCRSVSDDGFVVIDVKLTIGGCPLRAQIKKDIETRVATHPGGVMDPSKPKKAFFQKKY